MESARPHHQHRHIFARNLRVRIPEFFLALIWLAFIAQVETAKKTEISTLLNTFAAVANHWGGRDGILEVRLLDA